MKAIHVYSSRPLQTGRNASGLFAGTNEIALPECVELMMRLSALQWRKTNGEIVLYTDTPMKHYLARRGMLDCWNDVNTAVLDQYYRSYSDIDPDVFWSFGKFACYEHEKAPFACIDADLVVWRRLAFQDVDFAFAHWESVESDDPNYPPLSELHTPARYILPAREYLSDKACNMAITYLGDDTFKDEFVREVLTFMRGNHLNAQGRYATPEILFAEQRLPLALARRRGLRLAPIIDITWSPGQFKILDAPETYRNWFFSNIDPSKAYTHLWFHKKYLSENADANRAYCATLSEMIEQARVKPDV